jgi:methionine-S-sulfoxide reductase
MNARREITSMTPAIVRATLAAISIGVLALGVAAGPPAESANVEPVAASSSLETATFAGGCYWCTESDFDKVEGVVETVSGFMGGHTKSPTYEEVGTGATGHAEVVQVKYDPAKVSYRQLVDYFWRQVDVLDGAGQFCDRGSSYRPAIFAHTPEQQRIALESKDALERSRRFDRPIAVEIEPASEFTAGPEYHQDYYKKHPLKYAFYRAGCGRDQRLKQLWGDEASH